MGKVASIAAKRAEKELARQRKNRLMMLMHQFMDAADKTPPDEAMMKLVGRGLSGYTKPEINEANRVAKRQRMKPQPQPPRAS
jgi:hypothetical protein